MQEQGLLCDLLPAGVYHHEGYLTEPLQRLLVEVARDIVREAALVTPHDRQCGEHKFQTTSCGARFWCSKEWGIQYTASHPDTGRPLPQFPVELSQVVQRAVSEARLTGYVPDSSQVNFFRAGGRWPAHVDDKERDKGEPIVIIGLGCTAVLSLNREDKKGGELADIEMASGDVVILAGTARGFRYGVKEIKAGTSRLVRGDGHVQFVTRRVC
jgi:alkylated DNA repair protein (DNA oxidative demethylase)